MIPEIIRPDWSVPESVNVAFTTRVGGVSPRPFDSLNLGDHVGDDPAAVAENRQRVASALGLPAECFGWIRQVHGADVARLPHDSGAEADASVTREKGQICAILTADCLPVLFCSDDGAQVAAAHAGWRGLAAGVLEETLRTFPDAGAVSVWLGPAIGPDAFEVGPDVRDTFIGIDADAAGAFRPSERPGHFLADIYQLARQRLASGGVPMGRIAGGRFCTVTESSRFFSYRRDGQTGRMASLIWRE